MSAKDWQPSEADRDNIVTKLHTRNDDLAQMAAAEIKRLTDESARHQQEYEQEHRISTHRKAQIEHLKAAYDTAKSLLKDIRKWMNKDLGDDWDAEFIERIDALLNKTAGSPAEGG